MLLGICDVWTHEQDIGCALQQTGNLDSPAAAVCVSSILAQLPKRIAKGAAHEPGHRLVIDVTGSVVVRQGFHLELDQDGSLRGHAVSEPQ